MLDLDDYVQPTPEKLDYKTYFNSSLLEKNGKTKLTNENLGIEIYKEAPWKQKKYRDWNKTPLIDILEPTSRKTGQQKFIKSFEPDPEKLKQFDNLDQTKGLGRDYKVWHDWWKTNLTSEDYFKFLSTQTNDYLSLIFHLYDDKNGIELKSEELEFKEKQEKALREREKLINELKKQKLQYEPGVWNTQTVLLGGLGKDPELEDYEDPVALHHKSIVMKMATKKKKILLFNSDEDDDMNENENKLDSNIKIDDKDMKTPQQRLEKIWSQLHMSDQEKLDMAVKYCCDEYADKIYTAINDWEKITELIIQRENLILELENFERNASDPNRYYQKLNQEKLGGRLEEARFRDKCYKSLESLERNIKKQINEIQRKYKDTITYKGRIYLDKMKWDRIEMLHYLQEERRNKYLNNQLVQKKLSTHLLELC